MFDSKVWLTFESASLIDGSAKQPEWAKSASAPNSKVAKPYSHILPVLTSLPSWL